MPTAAPTTTDQPLDDGMRAIIARYRRVTTIGVAVCAALVAACAAGTVFLARRPDILPNQGEATAAAGLGTLILAVCLAPMLAGMVANLRRYAAIRQAHASSGPLRVEPSGLADKLTQFDPAMRGTNFDYLHVAYDRILLPATASDAVAALPAGTAVYASGGAILFEVLGPDGTVVYRCPGYAGRSEAGCTE